MPSMPGNTMSISTASKSPCAIALGGGLAAPDEFRLMTEFGQDRIEHDAAERIVLDAENAQRRRRRRGSIASAPAPAAFDVLGAGQASPSSVKVVPPPRRCATATSPPIARAMLLAPTTVRARRRRSATAIADIGLRERTEQPLDLGEREPDAAVGNREGDADLALRRRAPARPSSATPPCFGELHRIVDQVFQRRAQSDRIADHEAPAASPKSRPAIAGPWPPPGRPANRRHCAPAPADRRNPAAPRARRRRCGRHRRTASQGWRDARRRP